MAEEKDHKQAVPDLGMKGEGRHPQFEEALSEAERQARERRREIRVLLNIEVDYSSGDTFLFAYITDMSTKGIFIHTNTPEAVGTMLNLEFTIPGESKPLTVEGVVMWVNTYQPGDFDNLNPGMGVRFAEVQQSDQVKISSLVKHIADLEEAAANPPKTEG
mgnify:FL=1